jgi:hypothetical protein
MNSRLSARIAVALFCLLATAPFSRNQEFDRRDGDWWRSVDRVNKAFYLAGLVDGTELASRLSGNAPNDQGVKDASARTATPFAENRAKYLGHVTNIQLTDGLDAFYADARNRRILVSDAAWVVLNQLAGTPEAETQALIETSRKNADRE